MEEVFKTMAEIKNSPVFSHGDFSFKLLSEVNDSWVEIQVVGVPLVIRKYRWDNSLMGRKCFVMVNLRGACSIPLMTEFVLMKSAVIAYHEQRYLDSVEGPVITGEEKKLIAQAEAVFREKK